MDTFEKALEFTLRWEGGYANHPADPGGATNYGVTQRVYDHFRQLSGLPARRVRDIESHEVREIYRQHYWEPIMAHLLPEPLAIACFDWAVNAGPRRAIEHLQECLGVSVDGIIGPRTMAGMQSAGRETLWCFLQRREDFYRRIGRGPKRVFLKGWLNRLNDLRGYLEG